MLGKKIYRIWVAFWFFFIFLLIYPFFVLFIQKKSWHRYGHFLNKLWAHIFFPMVFMPTKVVLKFKPNPKKNYIYCVNHSSYMDIPSLTFALPGHFLFIGKASLTKLPLFGYMFRNLYIPVERESRKSKYETMVRCYQALDENKSIAIFPEGTIPKLHNPKLISFKEGAFRMAIEKQVPVVPVTIPYNYIILPDNGKYIPKRHQMKVIIHDPIETKDLTLDDLEELKKKTFEVIEAELKKEVKDYDKNSVKQSISLDINP